MAELADAGRTEADELVEPTDAELWGLAPDPLSDPAEDPDADLPWDMLMARLAGDAARDQWLPPELALAFPAGTRPRDGARGGGVAGCWPAGGGFAGGGVLDELAPGAVLAGFAEDTQKSGLGRICDDELIGVLRAWRRLASWAAAGEFAAITELSGRRHHQAELTSQDPARAVAAVESELACALTLTQRGAQTLLERAADLARLPGTTAALAAGVIDEYRARVIADQLADLDDPAARQVEATLLAKAASQTSGQLRAAALRAALAADPQAARQRQQQAERGARVEVWREPSGTASISGRDLPPTGALAADKRINTLARWLKKAGADAPMDQLRAAVFVALLTGTPVEHLLTHPAAPNPGTGYSAADNSSGNDRPGNDATGSDEDNAVADDAVADDAIKHLKHNPSAARDHPPQAAAARDPGARDDEGGAERSGGGLTEPSGRPERPSSLAALINLTVPLATLLGLTHEPGEAGGFGPVGAETATELATLAARHPASRWCITVTGPEGEVIGHGCAPPHQARSPGRSSPSPRRRDGASTAVGHCGIGDPDVVGDPDVRGSGGHGTGARSTADAGRWHLSFDIEPLARGSCDHRRRVAGYTPPPSLRHLVEIRDMVCGFPICRRPATQCDQDHTVPYQQGGFTCECNLGPRCRLHHQVKQAGGWQLTQPEPGLLHWKTPAGRIYASRTTRPPRTSDPPGYQIHPWRHEVGITPTLRNAELVTSRGDAGTAGFTTVAHPAGHHANIVRALA